MKYFIFVKNIIIYNIITSNHFIVEMVRFKIQMASNVMGHFCGTKTGLFFKYNFSCSSFGLVVILFRKCTFLLEMT